MADKRPMVSVCMIVKNEEELLGQALASVEGFADEIVIVDTGSTDRTVDIALQAGAKVYHHGWEFDFALHRNQSIDYATGEWIFILDADEELTASGVKLLLDAIKDPECKVISIPVFSDADGGKQESSHNSVRMWKAETGIGYKGAVHNEVTWHGETLFVEAGLIHYGYNLSREKMVAKFQRTTELLQREMKREPDNPKWPHYLAISYHTENMFSEALGMARRSIELCGEDEDAKRSWLVSYYLAAADSLSLGDIEGAESASKEALEIFSDYIDAWAVLTSVAFQRRIHDDLTESAKRYLELHDAYKKDRARFGGTPLHTLHHKHLVLLRLALSARWRGESSAFREYFDKALIAAREPAEVYNSVAAQLAGSGEFQAAMQLLDESLSRWPDNAELIEAKLRLLWDAGRFDDAILAIHEAGESGLPSETVDFLKGLHHLLDSSPRKAAESFSRVIERNPDNAQARINLGLSYERLGEDGEAEAHYLESINRSPEMLEAAINLGALYSRTKRSKEAMAFLEQVASINGSLLDVKLMLAKLFWEADEADKLFSITLSIGRLLAIPGTGKAESAEDLGKIFLETGSILSNRNDTAMAVVALEMAVNLRPQNVETNRAYGEALSEGNASAKALAVLERCVHMAPDDWRNFDALARHYERIGAEQAATLSRKKSNELRLSNDN